MNIDPLGRPLPRGCTFDPKASRYRVRLYANKQPVWSTSHDLFDDAMEAWDEARVAQHKAKNPPKPGFWAAVRRWWTSFKNWWTS